MKNLAIKKEKGKKAEEKKVRDMLDSWLEAPWFFCLFTVKQIGEDGTVLVQPEGAPPSNFPEPNRWDSLVLYSPQVVERYKEEGVELFLALLAPVHEVYYAFGTILPLYSIGAKDFRFFADIVDSSQEGKENVPLKGLHRRAEHLSDIIGAQPLPFFQLKNWNRRTGFRRTDRSPLVKCVSAAALSPQKCVLGEPAWRAAVEGRGKKLFAAAFEEKAAVLYIGCGTSLFDAMLYITYTGAKAFLFAMTEESYRIGRTAVSDICLFPEEPEVCASPWVVTAARSILDCRDEFSELQDYFKDTVEMWAMEEEGAENAA
ncbi:MAG: hypothetical protein ACLFMZ_11725 [Spirochaetaceae bacterium]